MFNANRILGMLMDSGMSRSGQSRVQRVAARRGQGAGSSGQSSGGGLAGMARSLFGGGTRGSGQSAGGSGGGLAGIASSLLGGGGRTGSATSAGGMGLLGALAGAAMQHFGGGGRTAQAGSAQPGAAGAAPGLAEASAPYGGAESGSDDDGRAMLMIRAMITAAKADGEIDPQERQKVLGRLEQGGADPEAQGFVREEMAKPADMNAIVSAVDSPQTAIEVYTASLFAIDVDTPAEKQYMRDLGQRLGLDPAMVRELHASLDAPPPN